MTNTVEDMVRVSTGELVTLIAIAAVRDENWPERANGVRPHLSDNALERIREVGQRLIDYANISLCVTTHSKEDKP
ncbi:MAG: hypothetical protein WC551_12915 [Patescibacteria group bacterium]